MSQSYSVKHKQSLDALQSMVNAVLIETGNALRSAYKKGPKTIGYTHDRLQEFLPGAIDKFHLALDELEGDIVRAKAVLGRDLRDLRDRRKQLEHPQVVQAENEVTDQDPAQPAPISTLQVPDPSPSQQTAGTVNVAKGEDFDMEGAAMSEKRSSEAEPDMLSLPSTLPLSTEGQIKSQESLEQSLQGPAGVKSQGQETNFQIPLDSDAPKTAHGLGITASSLNPPRDLEAHVSRELPESNFDPLFEIASNGDSEHNVDDFGFVGVNADGQNEDFGINSVEFDLSSFGNQPKNTDDDPDAMLQGLDNFGNDGDGNDYSMLDISNGATNNQGTDQNAGDDFGMSGGDLEFAMSMGANDSSFDDLLNGMDFADADNTKAGEMMDHGEFDDALFSTQ